MLDPDQTAPEQTLTSCVLDPDRARALEVALGGDATLSAGDPLPPFFHQLYFWDAVPPSGLGRDGHPQVGHPRVGGVIPDMGLPRRMWAGGRLQFHAPLRLGKSAQKRTVFEAATRKTGRSGALAVVTLRHEISQGEVPCVTEWQTLVYREEARADAQPPVPPVARTDEDSARTVHFDATLLFRYSALTFNGHRIHYDQPYAREVEGYDGLVVHGPLLAQLLMLEGGEMTEFTYQATAPLMHFEAAEICRKGDALWVRGPDGRQCMTATVGSLG